MSAAQPLAATRIRSNGRRSSTADGSGAVVDAVAAGAGSKARPRIAKNSTPDLERSAAEERKMRREACMTRLQKSLGIGLVIAGGLGWVAAAQFRQRPVLSPPTNASVTIEGKTIKIDYGAPSARGRKVMGGLVPYGEVWCTGANDATSIDTEADLEIGGMKVPKGSYTLWAFPNSNEWKLIVNKETG